MYRYVLTVTNCICLNRLKYFDFRNWPRKNASWFEQFLYLSRKFDYATIKRSNFNLSFKDGFSVQKIFGTIISCQICLYTVLRQRLTHFNSAQNLINASIFGVSIFGVPISGCIFSKFFGAKIDIYKFRRHFEQVFFTK